MTGQQRRGLLSLEGRLVHLSMLDGSRLDDVNLVSARAGTLWIYAHGEDFFLPVETVVNVWEAPPSRSAA